MDSTTNLPRAVILTALPVECQAVRAHLLQLHPESHPESSVYWSGFFSCESCTWDIKVAEIGPGNAGATLETERAISYLKPHVALFVGVAGGLKDVHIGDVVAARKIYCYETGKASNEFLPRPEIGNSTHSMLHWARFTASNGNWVQRIKGPTPVHIPKVFIDPIAAGEKVLDSTRSLLYTFLREQYSDALAVEMEGYGFLHAVQANQHVKAIVIRGISDLIEGKSEADAANSQGLAACHASAFAFDMLSKLGSDKHFMAFVAKTRLTGKTRKRQEPTVKYSITNNGQMAVGPNANMRVINNWRNSMDK